MHQKAFAKHLRRNMTDAERLLWRHLRAYRLNGRKFRRQQPTGPYVVDFVHFAARLIVECDGGQHNEDARDERRDAWLQRQGFQILRYWNHQILNETDHVLEDILNTIAPSPPAPLPRGERGATEKPLSPGGRGAGEGPNPNSQPLLKFPSPLVG